MRRTSKAIARCVRSPPLSYQAPCAPSAELIEQSSHHLDTSTAWILTSSYATRSQKSPTFSCPACHAPARFPSRSFAIRATHTRYLIDFGPVARGMTPYSASPGPTPAQLKFGTVGSCPPDLRRHGTRALPTASRFSTSSRPPSGTLDAGGSQSLGEDFARCDCNETVIRVVDGTGGF